MDGKNASGRRISLLNDNAELAPQPVRLSSFAPSSPSRSSSYTSSPIGSPPTPQLVRSNSSDSTAMQTPSPITPDYNIEYNSAANCSPVSYQSSLFPPQKELPIAYPPVPNVLGPLPYHPAPNGAQATYFRPQQPAEDRSTSASANPRSKKNSYPCPMAKQFNCSDYFTTSGHAARHAKKHTGKKDAFCPECNKAFTRKDNMEQHRRTHQSGRSAAKTDNSQVKKAKQQPKRPKPAPLQSSVPSLSGLSMLDPVLSGGFESNLALSPAVQPAESFSSTYPDPISFSMTHNYAANPPYGGLDALAIAASGEKRKFES